MTSTRGAMIAIAALGGLLAADRTPAASIDIGSASGAPGSDVTVSVSLRTMGAAVLGTLNLIEFDRETPVAARPDGRPDCAVNPAINKSATGFRFQPLGCDPAADCQAVRAVVLAFDNLDPIPDDSVLYSCRIAIAPGASEGTHALRNGEASASAAGGEPVPTTGTDGAVEVVAAPVAAIVVGSASGYPGSMLTLPVTLDLLTAPPAAVCEVRNDLRFGLHTPVASGPTGKPACEPGEVGTESAFDFLPAGCTVGLDCTGMRAAVRSSPCEPIARGAVLYTCAVTIAAGAPPGTVHVLEAVMPAANGSDGEPLAVIAIDGEINVSDPPLPACVGDCDGDRLVAVNELLVGVNIATGEQPLPACAVFDADGDGGVAVHELILAVNNALTDCP